MNGPKREQLIAMNSMILHELFLDRLGDQSEPGADLREARLAISALMTAGGRNSSRWARRSAAGQVGCCSHGRRGTANSSINGRQIIATLSPEARRFLRSTCTSIPITSTSAPRQPATVNMQDLSGYLIDSAGDWTVLNLAAIAEADERIPVGGGRFHLRRE